MKFLFVAPSLFYLSNVYFSNFTPILFHKIKKEHLDIDECVEERHTCDLSNSICVNTVGGYTCVCSPGYEGEGGVCVGEFLR